MLLSIIVPVYNTEKKKLKRCFESINKIDSRYLEFECIVVDDGSNKEIEKYCSTYCLRHNSFTYIRKKNGGVSSARNLGIEKAIGEYICFVDSDDEIISESFYFINKKCMADLYFTDLLLVDKDKTFRWNAFENGNREIEISDILRKMSEDGKINGPCCKFIKREFLLVNSIYFRTDMILGEDAIFLLDIIKCKPIIRYHAIDGYKYYKTLETGNVRLLNNTSIVIENTKYMYNRIIETIDFIVKNQKERKKLLILAKQRYIKQIFNIASKLSYLHRLTKEEKAIIYRSINCIDKEKRILDKNMGIKYQLQYAIIIKRKWTIVKVYALAREYYLSIKGLQ